MLAGGLLCSLLLCVFPSIGRAAFHDHSSAMCRFDPIDTWIGGAESGYCNSSGESLRMIARLDLNGPWTSQPASRSPVAKMDASCSTTSLAWGINSIQMPNTGSWRRMSRTSDRTFAFFRTAWILADARRISAVSSVRMSRTDWPANGLSASARASDCSNVSDLISSDFSSLTRASFSSSAFWFASAARAFASAVEFLSRSNSDCRAFSIMTLSGAANLSAINSYPTPTATKSMATVPPRWTHESQYDAVSASIVNDSHHRRFVVGLAVLWLMLRHRRLRRRANGARARRRDVLAIMVGLNQSPLAVTGWSPMLMRIGAESAFCESSDSENRPSPGGENTWSSTAIPANRNVAISSGAARRSSRSASFAISIQAPSLMVWSTRVANAVSHPAALNAVPSEPPKSNGSALSFADTTIPTLMGPNVFSRETMMLYWLSDTRRGARRSSISTRFNRSLSANAEASAARALAEAISLRALSDSAFSRAISSSVVSSRRFAALVWRKWTTNSPSTPNVTRKLPTIPIGFGDSEKVSIFGNRSAETSSMNSRTNPRNTAPTTTSAQTSSTAIQSRTSCLDILATGGRLVLVILAGILFGIRVHRVANNWRHGRRK